uniref:Carboxylesterase type B domain-containing protein n=1 Tax=Timema tahoe TaxID=61484 RepID=A0A7R9IU24_9NEOP|nr:unnamed protein product [Timema tahoe]
MKLIFQTKIKLPYYLETDNMVGVEVEVIEGTLRGRVVTTHPDKTYYSFQGVPYAKPPVGELRFKVRAPGYEPKGPGSDSRLVPWVFFPKEESPQRSPGFG